MQICPKVAHYATAKISRLPRGVVLPASWPLFAFSWPVFALMAQEPDSTKALQVANPNLTDEDIQKMIDEASVVLDKVRQGEGNFGYNAATGEYGDMIEMGILDPAKVTRTALQAAGSVAGLMITTEVMIAEAPKDDAPAPAMPDMGGMGGMM